MIGDELCAAPECGGEADDDDDSDGTGPRVIAVKPLPGSKLAKQIVTYRAWRQKSLNIEREGGAVASTSLESEVRTRF